MRFGTSAADLAAGMWVTIGIVAAVTSREQTGRGQHVDVALLDGLTAWLTYAAQNYFASGKTPRRYGSAHPNILPYQGFPTGDGDLMIAVGNDGLWRRFVHTVGLDHLVGDDRYATNPGRVHNREELLPIIEQALAAKSAEEWTDLLTEAGVPVGPILTVPETVTHPQVLARDMAVDLLHSTEGSVRTLGSPLKLSGTPRTCATPAPPTVSTPPRSSATWVSATTTSPGSGIKGRSSADGPPARSASPGMRG